MRAFPTTETGGRLIKDDERQIGGKRASRFENALTAKRQIAGEVIRIGAKTDTFQSP